jgi:hypothetical protein
VQETNKSRGPDAYDYLVARREWCHMSHIIGNIGQRSMGGMSSTC